MNDEHTTVHVYEGGQHVAGCTCGWVGKVRSTLQACIADELGHRQENGRLVLVPKCDNPECPVCYR